MNKITTESKVIIIICLLDLIITLILLPIGNTEGNPIASNIYKLGWEYLMLYKLILTVIPVAIIEFIVKKVKGEKYVKAVMRFTICTYIFMYMIVQATFFYSVYKDMKEALDRNKVISKDLKIQRDKIWGSKQLKVKSPKNQSIHLEPVD